MVVPLAATVWTGGHLVLAENRGQVRVGYEVAPNGQIACDLAVDLPETLLLRKHPDVIESQKTLHVLGSLFGGERPGKDRRVSGEPEVAHQGCPGQTEGLAVGGAAFQEGDRPRAERARPVRRIEQYVYIDRETQDLRPLRGTTSLAPSPVAILTASLSIRFTRARMGRLIHRKAGAADPDFSAAIAWESRSETVLPRLFPCFFWIRRTSRRTGPSILSVVRGMMC